MYTFISRDCTPLQRRWYRLLRWLGFYRIRAIKGELRGHYHDIGDPRVPSVKYLIGLAVTQEVEDAIYYGRTRWSWRHLSFQREELIHYHVIWDVEHNIITPILDAHAGNTWRGLVDRHSPSLNNRGPVPLGVDNEVFWL